MWQLHAVSVLSQIFEQKRYIGGKHWTYFLNWSIVDLQCFNFYCTAKWFSYTYIYIYIYIFFFMFFSIMVYHRILNIVLPVLYSRTLLFTHYIHNSLHLLIPNSQSIPPAPPRQPQFCSLCLWVGFCFVGKFICVIF